MEASNKMIVEEIKSKNGEIFFRNYQKGKFLGKVCISLILLLILKEIFIIQGGFARCIELVENDTRKKFAAKVISKTSLHKSRSKQKVFVSKKSQHYIIF